MFVRLSFSIVVYFSLLVASIPDNWNFTSANYERYMTVTSTLQLNNQISDSEHIALGAFVDGECRGHVYPVLVGNQLVYFLMVYSNDINEIVSFSIYDNISEEIVDVNEMVIFESSVSFGSPDVPYSLSAYNYLVGDFNTDGVLDVADIVGIINVIINQAEYSEHVSLDLNADGVISVTDIVAFVTMLLDADLGRQIVWYYNGEEWVHDNMRGEVVSQSTIYNNSNDLSIYSNGDIAGIQLEVEGDYSINNNYIPEGWSMHYSNNVILMYSLDGSHLTQNKLFEYTGDLTITNSLIVDWYGGQTTSEHIEAPSTYKLIESFPNPFNPSTNIKFTLPEESNVNISIYNIHGKLIEELYEGVSLPGVKQLQWDASQQSSGIYFVKMMSNKYKETQKITLIK